MARTWLGAIRRALAWLRRRLRPALPVRDRAAPALPSGDASPMAAEAVRLGAGFDRDPEVVAIRKQLFGESGRPGDALIPTAVVPREEPAPTRRAVFGAAAVAGASLTFAGSRPAHAAPPAAGGHAVRRHKWGMAIDLDRCTACGACTVACREENNVPVLGPGDGNDGARPEWMSLLWRDSEGPAGLPEVLPFPCQHCEDAPCTKVCPVGATFIDDEGLVAQIYDRCIGCRYCMVACPYSRRSFNWTAPQWDGSLVQMLNPDVATRPQGVVEKCTFCTQRIRRVKETAALEDRGPTDDELRRLPACAAACPANAITFGDLNDANSEVVRQHQSPRAFRLLEHLGTKPVVAYLKRDRRS